MDNLKLRNVSFTLSLREDIDKAIQKYCLKNKTKITPTIGKVLEDFFINKSCK